jgi:Arc/MetJ family transcription regulator
MRTNIVIDDQLMAEAMKVGRFKTKREAVEAALQRLVQANRYQRMIELFGRIEWEGDLNAMRRDRSQRRPLPK